MNVAYPHVTDREMSKSLLEAARNLHVSLSSLLGSINVASANTDNILAQTALLDGI